MGDHPKPRILIVDDASANIEILDALLGEDYQTSFAMDGARALQQARDETPDLVLLDVMMAGLDGYEVCKRLKAMPEMKDVPVIFISSLSDEADVIRGLEIGAVDYIRKPFRAPIVRARIRNHLELKRHRNMLEQLAQLDALTGIPNRRRLDQVFALEWSRLKRTGLPLSVLMIDVDYFKAFNDHYGHASGDACLREVARALAGCPIGAGDLLARYGGEEFTAILLGSNQVEAEALAEAFRRAVQQLAIPHGFSEAAEHVTISLGSATAIPEIFTGPPAALFRFADAQLYLAKSRGRNQAASCDLGTLSLVGMPPRQ